MDKNITEYHKILQSFVHSVFSSKQELHNFKNVNYDCHAYTPLALTDHVLASVVTLVCNV